MGPQDSASRRRCPWACLAACICCRWRCNQLHQSEWLQTACIRSRFLHVRTLWRAPVGLLLPEPSQAGAGIGRAAVSSEGSPGGIASQLPPTVVGRIQSDQGPPSPAGCWLEASLSPLPRGPVPHGSLMDMSRPRRGENVCQQERVCKTEVAVFVNSPQE